MQCPSCQNTDSRVLESRSADAGKCVRRRRECLNCDFRFTTYERVETIPVTVIKRSNAKEIFCRSKLLNGLTRACEKTSINNQKIEAIVDEIETHLQQSNLKEISSVDLGEMILLHLKSVNEVAYIRFASVYRQFNGIEDFIDTLESFKPSNKFAAIS
ncbi:MULTISPECIES: transcriptional regulator NrdR [Prochlorococcus]|uniref:Transcriptional repressor NrdR n=1 Tax=Prochlorococcus marinus (strain SARG / CCMP1375 / SS120) TaxID=167539 RepID=NRDR_PROMA|nr:MULTISPECIES: transcriptional regulator NrdR [Prochlorococcus]Q7VDM4.1 RecName: Full=Transcriptional repressor NrdR [Prochlorococcus marinus subsp. marinus str. CCMP1375]AAP99398.1 Predicted Zn-ribbon and ATP-cone domain-containing transcriptional regulator [Prochlorococcus marinus subsp. marinus str. CCMP1375]KGG11330.1 Ribonucleotide reductase transcriptional regulator NrdR [Prochlorococcus marinus str. LG]KGG18714.1 Ribonucleotide reductase transcriptional regulator NrdR [Prochlorococcus 